jgi:RNA polymerase sigma factor (sigma-70 family)
MRGAGTTTIQRCFRGNWVRDTMKSSPLRHPARLAGSSLLRLQSDERLAELAIDGHDAAFDAIVDRYRPAIQRYCTGIVGPSRAEDATQQTLINAHDALKRTDEVRHLRSWLYRIAHNVSLNVLRAVRDDVPLDDLTARDAALGHGEEPPAAFERSERFRATVAALQELPERQRAALVLRELEGRSHAEIADALGVTQGSARQHLMRARVAMRGAVTAITPYPLIVRLSDMLSTPGGAGWADAAAGAGAGATLAKLTAGVVATGALVGGAVGTHEVIQRDGGTLPRVAEAGAGGAKSAAAVPAATAAGAPGQTVAVADLRSRRSAGTAGARTGTTTTAPKDHDSRSSRDSTEPSSGPSSPDQAPGTGSNGQGHQASRTSQGKGGAGTSHHGKAKGKVRRKQHGGGSHGKGHGKPVAPAGGQQPSGNSDKAPTTEKQSGSGNSGSGSDNGAELTTTSSSGTAGTPTAGDEASAPPPATSTPQAPLPTDGAPSTAAHGRAVGASQ